MIDFGNRQKYEYTNVKLGDNFVSRIYLGGPENLLNFNVSNSMTLNVSENNYNCAWTPLYEPIEIKAGDKFIFSVENIEVLEGEPKYFSVCLFNYPAAGDKYGLVSNWTHVTKEKPYCILTATKDTTLYTMIWYAGLSGQTQGNSVKFEKLMLIKGDTLAPIWTPNRLYADDNTCLVFKQLQPNNLLLGTKEINPEYWGSNYAGGWAKTSEVYNGCTVWSKYTTGKNPYMGWYYKPTFEITEDCTFSVYAKVSEGTANINTYIQEGPSRGHKYVNSPVTTEWKRYYLYLKAGDFINTKTANGIIEFWNFSTVPCTAYVAGFKLEKGHTPYTEWSEHYSETYNFLVNSNQGWYSNEYKIATIPLNEYYNTKIKIEAGELCTITIWGELGTGKTGFKAFNSGGLINFGDLKKIGDNIYQNTFRYRRALDRDTHVNIYVDPNKNDGEYSTINYVKLEKGYNPNPVWTPNPLDTEE